MFTTRPGGLLQLHTLTSWLDRKDDTAKRPVATVAKGSNSDSRSDQGEAWCAPAIAMGRLLRGPLLFTE